MIDTIELQRKLMEARNGIHQHSKYIVPRTAAAKKEKDAIELLELGVSPTEISNLLGILLSEVARIQEHDRKRRKFLATGELELPNSPTVIGVFNGLPTRR